MNAEKPFNFESTPGKLPKQVVPLEYSIRIVPNIDRLTFTGTETVKLDVRSPVRELMLNALEIEIANASIDDKPIPKGAIKIDNKNELLTIALPSQLPAGLHMLALGFSGKINRQGRGLFYMRYQEEGTGAKKIALGTQFEATDARSFFPCWDEPSFRARFQLTAVVPENWLAVSNMPVESERKIDKGKEVRFATTPPMLPECFRRRRAGFDRNESSRHADSRHRYEGQGRVGALRARKHGADSRIFQRLLRRSVSAAQARSNRHSRRIRRRDGKLGRHYLLRISIAFRSREILRRNAAAHLRSDRARDRAHVVWRSRDHGVVGQSLAQRRFCLVDGNEMHRPFQSAMGSLVGERYSARSDTAHRDLQGIRDGRRCQIDNSRDPATDCERGGGQQRLRRHHLPQRPGVSAHAREFSWRKCFSRRHPPLHGRAQIFELDHGGFVERVKRRFRQTRRRNRSGMDGTAGISGGQSETRRRKSFTYAGAIHNSFSKRARAAVEDSPHLLPRRRR